MPVNGFDTTISWSDFQPLSSRPQGVDEDAQIHPEMRPGNIKLGRKSNAVVITDITIDITLVGADCWVVSGQSSNDLLKHEQGHYDILALSAREFHNKLLKLSAKSTQDLQQQVNDLKSKMEKTVQKVDKRYDTQTNHSRDTQNQQLWNKKISEEKQKPDGSIDNLP